MVTGALQESLLGNGIAIVGARRRTRPHPQLAMSDQTAVCQHKWTDVYNGTKCLLCETFYPFGCAPWDDEVKDGFDFGNDSDEPDEWDEDEEDGALDLEDRFDRSIARAFERFKK